MLHDLLTGALDKPETFLGRSTLFASSESFSGSIIHNQFMFGCCFMSHLACLFESELTIWAQGHEVYPSLCLCICVSTHLICLHKICLSVDLSALLQLIHPALLTPPFLKQPANTHLVPEVISKRHMSLSKSAVLSHFLHGCSSLCVCVNVTQ